ncbi:hypothetical protein CATMQ487_37730 [Sphaerotilus microaerophilus]|uniref:Uncharacterized protein n=1 Tax=Sphaerotilus microaerophilus TaxID=2914710 RepID=A0ABN6PQC5_9BURK|nr:hypothetical protein CATMQ487_37730 [Sphaerotilus sp. FB-5]
MPRRRLEGGQGGGGGQFAAHGPGGWTGAIEAVTVTVTVTVAASAKAASAQTAEVVETAAESVCSAAQTRRRSQIRHVDPA